MFGEFRAGRRTIFEEIFDFEAPPFVPLFISVKTIIRPGYFNHEIDFCARPHAFHPTLTPPPFDFTPFSSVSGKVGRSVGAVWQSRINGDLIKDYSWTKIKINLTPAAEETNKRGRGRDEVV